METRPLTPLTLFNLPQHLTVPLYQRAYVWDEERQWEPLWEDIRRLAELRIGAAPGATHFLGAVVLQREGGSPGMATRFGLVDGQQRLTTLQLILDSAEAEFRSLEFAQQANRMRALTHNSADMGFDGIDQLKLVHSNDDGDAFQQVMMADPPVDYGEFDDTLITRAHRYFSEEIRGWLMEVDGPARTERVDALTDALMQGLELVVITLEQHEDAQAIFETLNARGTPLTQADLVKNFIFQRLGEEGADTRQYYLDHWKPLEDDFWTGEVRLGRYSIARVALFINHWLVAQTGTEISTQATFSRFKQWANYESRTSMTEIVDALERQSVQYRRWVDSAAVREGDLDPPALFVYRTQAAGFEAVKPIVLWLYDDRNSVPGSVREAALKWVESWVLRRSLLRRPGSDISRTMAALIGELRLVAPENVADRAQAYLSSLDGPGNYWPSDRELLAEIERMPAYRVHPRGRLRMFLEAIEDHERGFSAGGHSRSGSRVPRDSMHIEHVLPQSWKRHWPVGSLREEVDRDAHIHLFGNLTLLTSSLNSAISNGPWLGNPGKREALVRHDLMLTTRRLRDLDHWDEAEIERRTEDIAGALVAIWPVPEGHEVFPKGVGTGGPESTWVEFRELVAAGLLAPGAVLRPRGDQDVPAVVTDDGRLTVGTETYDSPSGAGKAVLGRNVNGWTFWRVDDGRTLTELKTELPGGSAHRKVLLREFWESALSRIREAHPSWTRAQTSGGSWVETSIGVNGMTISMHWYSEGLTAQVYMGSPDAELNSRRYKALLARRVEFERALGGTAVWEPMAGLKGARVALEPKFTELDDREQWDDAITWLIDAQVGLRRALDVVGPLAGGLVDEDDSIRDDGAPLG